MSDERPVSRSMILFGTEEPVLPWRRVRAGRLSAEIDRGNIRYVRWGGFEVLRAISFVVRDTAWGTYALTISNFVMEETDTDFAVRYHAACEGPEGDFAYEAEIVGDADGKLVFSARGESQGGFRTNRAGFVVLHGLNGVVGEEVDVEHTSGMHASTRFPERIDPNAPFTDIRALTHWPRPGLSISVRMEGEAFEMEDQRNWTDASFKTYVRPLSLGYPYEIAAGETVEQAVELQITQSGSLPATSITQTQDVVSVEIGAVEGVVPAIGLSATTSDLPSLKSVSPSYLVIRIDARDSDACQAIGAFAMAGGIPLDLDVVVSGRSPDSELKSLARELPALDLRPQRILLIPARDLGSRPADCVPRGEVDGATLLAAGLRAFPGCLVGVGTSVGFPEFNRNRPPPETGFLAHSTQACVHAADDVSVMETLEALGDVIRTARSFAPHAVYRLGPGTIGAPAAFYAMSTSDNPLKIRKTVAERDPRQRGLFAASFALGYVAAAARLGVDAVTLASVRGPAGIFGEGGPLPISAIVAPLSRLAGRARRAVDIHGPGISALAAQSPSGVQLWLANTTAEPITVKLDRPFPLVWNLDAQTLQTAPALDIATHHRAGEQILLDAYAIACLSEA